MRISAIADLAEVGGKRFILHASTTYWPKVPGTERTIYLSVSVSVFQDMEDTVSHYR